MTYSLRYLIDAACALEKPGTGPLVREASMGEVPENMTGVFFSLMPFLEGFEPSDIRVYESCHWKEAIADVLGEAYPRWLSIDKLLDLIHSGVLRQYEGFRKRWFLRDVCENLPFHYSRCASLDNPLMKRSLSYPRDGALIDREILASYLMSLYAMGGLEVAFGDGPSPVSTPMQNMQMVRLTALGRYAVGLDDEYVAAYPEVEEEEERYFDICEDSLHTRSLIPGSIYENYLMPMATSLGNHEYEVSYKSCLSRLRDGGEVRDRVEEFRREICAEPPRIWEDFFAEAHRRSSLVKNVSDRYTLFEVPTDDSELKDTLDNGPKVRRLFVKVGNGLILVTKKSLASLKKVLREKGYIFPGS